MTIRMTVSEEMTAWPTERWLALRERGRQIIEEDPELWDSEILIAFGF